MRRILVLVALALLALPAVPVGAATSSVACPQDDGRERLGLEGASYTFEAPAAPANANLPRQASFYLKADLAPAATANFDISLTWGTDDPVSDYDLYVFDAAGTQIGSSAAINALDGPGELVSVGLGHCDDILVAVRNFTGQPGRPLTLALTKRSQSGAVTCVADDPAPGCAGKAPGEAPDPVADTRQRLWLGGDRPGQAAMLHGFATTSGVPLKSALVPQRPTSGQPNTYTRAVLGNYTLERNLLMAFYTVDFAQPRAVRGTVNAAVWVSSATLNQGGTLYAQLWADGSLAKEVTVPGAAVGTGATLLRLSFDGLDLARVGRLTFQLGTNNPVGTDGLRNPADTTFTVYYDSVQYPSGLTLPR